MCNIIPGSQSPGSFLVNIFINDQDENKGCMLIRFSDDTQLRKIEICHMT